MTFLDAPNNKVPAIKATNSVTFIGRLLSKAYPNTVGNRPVDELAAAQQIRYRVDGPTDKVAAAKRDPNRTATINATAGPVIAGATRASSLAEQTAALVTGTNSVNLIGQTKAAIDYDVNPFDPKLQRERAFAVAVVHDPVTYSLVDSRSTAAINIGLAGSSTGPALFLQVPDRGEFAGSFYEIASDRPSEGLLLAFSVAIDNTTRSLDDPGIVTVSDYNTAAFRSLFGFNNQDDFVHSFLSNLEFDPSTHTSRALCERSRCSKRR
jgi:hypothetical protein